MRTSKDQKYLRDSPRRFCSICEGKFLRFAYLIGEFENLLTAGEEKY